MENRIHTDATTSAPEGGNTALATALDLIDKGFSPIWLTGKRPLEKGWQKIKNKSATELQQSYAPGYNLGVRCGKWSCPKAGHGLVLVDVDVYDREYAQAAYDKLAELTGGSTGAYVNSGSRRGGRHYWYACPLDKLPNASRKVIAKSDEQVEFEINGTRKTKAAWVIEVLGTGAQVVVPPSIHPDTGKTYEWGEGWEEPGAILDIPEQLLNAISGGSNTLPKSCVQVSQAGMPLGECRFIQHCLNESASLEEPLWHAAACNLALCDGGREAFHQLSRLDTDRYNPSDTNKKFDRAEKEGKPHTCERINEIGFTCPKMRSDGTCAAHGGRAPVVFAQPEKQKDATVTSKIVDLAAGFKLTHDADSKTFVQIPEDGHYETWRLRSADFSRWLTHQYYRQHDKVPADQALKDALKLLEAQAQFEGEQVQAYRRLAPYKDGIILDLCDANWDCVKITKDGWEIIPIPTDVTLIRTRGMLELPPPVREGNIDELWEFVNVSEKDRPLTTGWLLATLNPSGPYPIFVLQGEQGSAKSTSARNLRSLVDPHSTPLRSTPKSEHDLIIAASNSRVVCLDNLSGLSPGMSDALCRLATGGGFSTRELYTDDGEMLFEVQRPIILNGIDDIATRHDVLDRSLLISTPVIAPDKRRAEKGLKEAFEKAQPRILGALLDAVSCALRNQESTKLQELPRMADFAIWATAAEPALGLQPGEFMDAYAANRKEAIHLNLEQDSVAEAIKSLLVFGPIQGNYQKILNVLKDHVKQGAYDSLPCDFPKAARGMSNRLKRLIPALRAEGIEVKINDRSHGKNHVEIRDVKFELLERQLEEQYAA
jgi:hypothetical protein